MGQKGQYWEELLREEHTCGKHMWLSIQSIKNSRKALTVWNANESSQSWKKHLLWCFLPFLQVFPDIYIIDFLCKNGYEILGIVFHK